MWYEWLKSLYIFIKSDVIAKISAEFKILKNNYFLSSEVVINHDQMRYYCRHQRLNCDR